MEIGVPVMCTYRYDYRYGNKKSMQPSRRRKKNRGANLHNWRASQRAIGCDVIWEANKSIVVKEEPSSCEVSDTNCTEVGLSMEVFVKTDCDDEDEELQPPVKVFVKGDPADDSDPRTAWGGNRNDVDPLQCPSGFSTCDATVPEFQPVKPINGFLLPERSLETKDLLSDLVNSRSLWQRNSNKCCYPGCTATRRTRPDLHFFLFPSGSTRSWGERRLERWLSHCGYDVETEMATGRFWNQRVCSLHFDKSDLIRTSTRVVLKYDSVPIDFNLATRMESCPKDEPTTGASSEVSAGNRDGTRGTIVVRSDLINVKQEPLLWQ